ncbi:MAG TPA: SRPBCC domain-containing protein [Acidimicrobiales bacterium]
MTRDGELMDIDGRPALRFERTYAHPMERVWRAVTSPEEMAAWFPSSVQGERAVGAALVFDDEDQRAAAREAGEPTRADGPLFSGTVVAYDPPKVFSFTWGGELLRLELLPDGAGTRLVFTHLLSHQSVAARNGAGWHMCLAELDRLLDAPAPTPEDPGDPDGMDVYDLYVERIGPSLGVPSGDGSLTWERSTHVTPEQVRAATTDPEELAAWGAAAHQSDGPQWQIEPTEHGSTYRLSVDVAGDASRAARWHALLLQLDMHLAAGVLIPADPERWIEPYKDVI